MNFFLKLSKLVQPQNSSKFIFSFYSISKIIQALANSQNEIYSGGVASISINFLTSFFNPPHTKKINKLHQISYKVFSLSTKIQKIQIQINCILISNPTFFMFVEFHSIIWILRNCITVSNSVMCSRI